MSLRLSVVRWLRAAGLAALCVLGTASGAFAQGGWDVAVYPVLGWLPLGININVDVPPFDGGGGTGGDRDIIDGRFDGAFLGGFTAQKNRFRVEGDFVWAAVGGDRLETPIFSVDADVIYAHGNVGFGLTPELFVTGGVRRFAIKYTIDLANQPQFERKPGLWDPLIGVGWHKIGEKLDWHASVEGGGFGVGADVDFSAGFRLDWKPITHFGLTGGYNVLYFKASDTVASREFTFKQTLHGPVLGIGLYF
jgi:hypothetical protein